jgi:hypothetical protein
VLFWNIPKDIHIGRKAKRQINKNAPYGNSAKCP